MELGVLATAITLSFTASLTKALRKEQGTLRKARDLQECQGLKKNRGVSGSNLGGLVC